jgi:RNA polymerase sigma factor (TIGR02999 family)
MHGVESNTKVQTAGPPGDTTEFLKRMAEGDAAAREEVFRRLYTELHRIACRVAAKGNREGTLQATDLIGEASDRLERKPEVGWTGREHFLATAAIAMRQVLIDHVRARDAEKRGGARQRVANLNLDQLATAYEERTGGLLRFDAELSRLAKASPRAGQIVDLRFFGGFSVAEVARLLSMSVRAVEREWTFAKAFLKAELG